MLKWKTVAKQHTHTHIYIYIYIYDGCEAKWLHPKLGQRRASSDARRKNLTGQWPRLNSSVSKLQQLISKDGVCWWELKKQPLREYHKSNPKRTSKLHPFHAFKQGAHSAEIGTLVSVFKKSVTEPNPDSDAKNMVNMAIFNVRTLNTLKQQPELTVSAAEYNIDIICMQNHGYYHSELESKYQDIDNGWTFVSSSAWKNTVNSAIGGLGMLLSPRSLKSLKRGNPTEN